MKNSHILFSFLFYVLVNALEHDFCGTRNDGIYPHPDNCTKYISCLQTFTFEMECPGELVFDEVEKMCNWNDYATCSASTPAPPTTIPHNLPDSSNLPTASKASTLPTTPPPGKRVYEDAKPCNITECQLPACRCPSNIIPGGLSRDEIPQMMLITMDDAIRSSNYKIYSDLFNDFKNPNGCPIKATFFVSHDYTDYAMVSSLKSLGHEIADHSVTQRWPDTFWKEASYEELEKEILKQRENLKTLGKVNDLKGWRSPYLKIGENTFRLLADNNFLYDSSIPTNDGQRWWPYTLKYLSPNYPDRCPSLPCRKKSYPYLWEIPLNSWVDGKTGIRCSMFDACFRSLVSGNPDSVYNLFKMNFEKFYNDKKQPFNMFGIGAYFDHPDYMWRRKGFKKFIRKTLEQHNDVYFVTMEQAIQWMRNPTALKGIKNFKPWSC